MKLITISLFSTLFFFSCANSIISDQCIDKSKLKEQIICTMQYDPVCGCDNVTYGNACEAERTGVLRWEKGECKNEK